MDYEKPFVVVYDESALSEIVSLARSLIGGCTQCGGRIDNNVNNQCMGGNRP